MRQRCERRRPSDAVRNGSGFSNGLGLDGVRARVAVERWI
jgi:hypothetical protein